MTKLTKYFIIFFLALGLTPARAQSAHYTISPLNADAVLSADGLRSSVEELCSEDMGGRRTGTEGGIKAAAWLDAEFRSIGLEPLSGAWMHGFVTSDGLARNIMGIVPGSQSRYVIVMAHYDNLGYLGGTFYPGADSNASGVAALLQLARMAKKMKECRKEYSSGIIFVALDAKEKNRLGAAHLWEQLNGGRLLDPATGSAITPSQISLAVNLDQLGTGDAPITKGNTRYLMMLSGADGRRDILNSVNRSAGFGFELAYDYYGSKDFTNLFYRRVSDQSVFLEHGISSVMFTSGITLLNNKPGDTPETLDYELLASRTRLIFWFLDRIL